VLGDEVEEAENYAGPTVKALYEVLWLKCRPMPATTVKQLVPVNAVRTRCLRRDQPTVMMCFFDYLPQGSQRLLANHQAL
jgi:hypothetical protein